MFDRQDNPVAERLIYRNHGRNLRVELTPDRATYGPRDEVVLGVRTLDPSGAPLPAELALSVVDDAVIGLADDKEGHMLSRLYLEPELLDSPKDPAWYFDPEEALAARGVDLVLGTRGWRRFDWRPVLQPPVVAEATSTRSSRREREMWDRIPMAQVVLDDMPVPMAAPEMAMPMAAPMPPPPMMEPMPMPPPPMMEPMRPPVAHAPPPMDVHRGARAKQVPRRDRNQAEGRMHGGLVGMGYLHADEDLAWEPWATVRVFPRPEPRPFTGVRSDFRDTVHWEPKVMTDEEGRATVRFHLSDAVTAFRITAEGLGGGFAGHEEATLSSVLPVSVATRLPVAVSAGDQLYLPLTVTNTRPRGAQIAAQAITESPLLTVGEGCTLDVGAGASETCWVPIEVGQGQQLASLRVEASGEGISDAMDRALPIVAGGFPRAWGVSGEHEGVVEHRFTLEEAVPGSLRATVTWHPSTVSTLMTGMEGMIGTPGGCFEQTSSTNWPNVAILTYLEAHDGDPRLRASSGQALRIGYDKLTGYQVSAGGFETWGTGPGKEVLSAFGLLQFTDMKRVFPVADGVLSKNAKYLLQQRNGKGGFRNTGESAHGYGSAPQPVIDGFITWSLVSTGYADQLKAELAHQPQVARTSDDPYVLALATRSLIATKDPGAAAAVKRLAALQAKDGGFPGAQSSITRSYEANLDVESTALAALALMESGSHRPEADKAAAWLVSKRQGAGTWGATQATALALSALTAHAEQARRPTGSGTLSVEIGGRQVGTLRYAADQSAPLVIEGLEAALKTGENTLVLRHEGGSPLPYTIDVQWTSLQPASAPGAELALRTSLDRASAKMGETVRLTARIQNKTAGIVPSPIARIGLPAGLEPQDWQLKQLKDRGEIAFYETRPREVTLYWDGVHVDAAHEVKLDLVAAIPGRFTGPASSAYPYYNDDEKAWSQGLGVTIAPPR